jgi:heat shock protein HslJ
MIMQYSISFSNTRSTTISILICYCLLNACKTTYKPDPTKSAVTRANVMPPDSLIKKQQKGIDFYAEGNIPVSWTIELDLENGFTFNPSGSQQLIAGPVPVIRLSNAESYLSKTDSGIMKLIVYDEPCSSNDKSSRKTEVTINNKRYSGCGKYLYDYQLNNTWVLQYIDNREPEQSNYKKLPRIEFDLTKNTMTGYDGCNNISSSITVNGNHIKFSAFPGLSSACSNNTTAKIFATMLSDHTVDYNIENGRLIIYLINDSKLTFTKAE